MTIGGLAAHLFRDVDDARDLEATRVKMGSAAAPKRNGPVVVLVLRCSA
jgi:hypothetical protein